MTDPENGGFRKRSRKPAAFRVDDRRVHAKVEEPEPLARDRAPVAGSPEEAGPKAGEGRRFGWGKIFAVGAGGLLSLGFGLAIDALIRDLFTRNDWLGWAGVVLAGMVALGLFGLVLREIAGLLRLRRIDELRMTLAGAAQDDDEKRARRGLMELIQLYKVRPETAAGRRRLREHMREVIDGRDLITLAERDLLSPLDRRAKRIVTDSAKRVSVVTAVSPRALVDLLMVLYENFRLIRRLSDLYGGRPGFLGFLRLFRKVVMHLAVTGGMAAGDSLVSQLLGHGLAAKLSARLGEGVVNGLLTARIGIAAIDVCRPAPFVSGRGPSVSDVTAELFRSDPEAKALLEEVEQAGGKEA
ncbi:TIGR01620 family protein [Rhizobiales bacterium]|uniref:YcjF family protein n=1 Tax=Hongsoonwoonella zoysiae TaxID=2821844 RepID=UPI0015607AAC|nr:TIGR01620 family protein [Hongsoonwoonella zoysiae]NRG17996.1 TIGR01620 family protein [Hongsoonwoonella zoysiae]